MHAYTLPYELDEPVGRLRITRLSVTVESEDDSVAAIEGAIAAALAGQRDRLNAGNATVSALSDSGQRTVSYRPDLAIANGRITRLDFAVQGRPGRAGEARTEIESWFPNADLMARSSSDYSSNLGCSPSLLAIICFILLVAILLASITGEGDAGSSSAVVTPTPGNVLPNPTSVVVPPVQVVTPLVDCSQIVDEAQRQQCQQAQGGALCESGCIEYPLRCELEVIKGDIDKGSGQKLYYVQQHPQYTQILIEPETGERWFCFAQAAEQAGWTRSP